MNQSFKVMMHLGLIIAIFSSFTIVNAQISVNPKHSGKAYGIIKTVEQFKNLISSTIPTVIKFSAPWCGPCKQMEPAYNSVAGQYVSRVQFYEFNTSDAQLQPLVKKYNIQGLPTIAYFHKGKEIKRDRQGAMSKQELNNSVQQFLVQVGSKAKVQPTTKKPQVKSTKKLAPKTEKAIPQKKAPIVKKQTPITKPVTKKTAVKVQPVKKKQIKKPQQTICY